MKKSKVSAVTEAFCNNVPFLRRFAANYLKNQHDIDDLMHDVFEKAIVAEKEQAILNPRAFLFTVAKNMALNSLNKKSTRLTDYLEDCGVDETEFSGDALENEISAEQVVKLQYDAMCALPDKCRKVYFMRKIHGLSHKEIAEELGISARTVEKHLKNGMLACNEYIRNHEKAKYLSHAQRKRVQPDNVVSKSKIYE